MGSGLTMAVKFMFGQLRPGTVIFLTNVAGKATPASTRGGRGGRGRGWENQTAIATFFFVHGWPKGGLIFQGIAGMTCNSKMEEEKLYS